MTSSSRYSSVDIFSKFGGEARSTEVKGSGRLDSDLMYFFFKNVNTEIKGTFCITLVRCNTINVMKDFRNENGYVWILSDLFLL